jgi:Fe-S-cluster containining protein
LARFYRVVAHNGQQVDETGPKFLFDHPEVVAKGLRLVELTRDLRDALLQSPDAKGPIESETAYHSVIRILTPRMASLYAAYDAYITSVLATGESPVACRPSCPSCCSHYVTSVEGVELLFLDAVLRTSPDYADFLFSMHERTTVYRGVLKVEEGEEAEDKALHRYFLKGKKCPFLTGTGDCGIREVRPMSCRMFFSLSDPLYCKGKRILSLANRNFHVSMPDEAETYLAEASAVLKRLRLSEHLFDGLLRVNEALGRFSAPTIS